MIKTEIYDLLISKIPKENIYIDEQMSKHTSFKIGGNAEFFIKAKNVEQVKEIIKIVSQNNIPLTIVGNGSNILVSDSGIKGIVLKIEIDNIDIEKVETIQSVNLNEEFNKSKKAIVRVGAGVLLGKLAQILLKESITGFEFASGIPGTIGGAVRMNAGAYGAEFKDIVLETTCMDLDGNIFVLSNNEQKFEYRKSIFKDKKYIVLETKLLLEYVENNSCIKEKMDEYRESRMEKQPVEFPSAGSTFKRGEDFITAKLIDECGLKGYSIGGAQVSIKHAGFIINTGNATARDVIDLTEFIKRSVYEKFGKNIELEIEVIGE